MDRIQNKTTAGANQHPISHSVHNNPSIAATALYGAALTAGLFVPLGLLIGLDRAPGSFYSYGLSCFFWPGVSMVLLGSIVGASLGFVFGSIAHGSDDPTPESAAVSPNKVNAGHKGSAGLSLHLPRH